MTVDSEILRSVMSQFATGVTVVTFPPFEEPHGITVNAFTSVSLDPPVVLFCLDHDTRSYELLDSGTVSAACVNVLSASQQELGEHFAGMTDLDDPFEGATLATTDAPVLADSLAYLDCEIREAFPVGDHTIFTADVVDAAIQSDSTPALTFFRGEWGVAE